MDFVLYCIDMYVGKNFCL